MSARGMRAAQMLSLLGAVGSQMPTKRSSSACMTCGSLACGDHERCMRRFNAAHHWRLWIAFWAGLGNVHYAFEAGLAGRQIGDDERRARLASFGQAMAQYARQRP